MMNRFMISVATAVLIAGSGLVYAQGSGAAHEAPAAGAAMQAGVPAEREGSRAAEPERPSIGSKAARTEPRTPAASSESRAEDRMQEPKTTTMGSDKSEPTRTGARENGAQESGTTERKAEGVDQAPSRDDRRDMKAEGLEKAPSRDDRRDMKAEGREDRNGNMKAESREGNENRSRTVGQAGAGARLSTEQRARITTAIRDVHVQPLVNVNFPISVGARVPRDVDFHPLPAEIVSMYPDWRGYEFILVRDQILVVDPETFEIVAVLET